jgi:hypothetical protein
MTAEQSSERPRVGRDFRLRVVWNGLEDKPFYKAVLLSASRASEAGHEPFWGYAVVSADEIGRVVDAAAASGAAWQPGPYSGQKSEYFADLETESGGWHAALGFEPQTLAQLNAIALALDEAHRKPIADVISRIRGELGSGSPAR